MQNLCWDCEHNTLKLKILVPYDSTIKEYMHNTSSFQSEIVAVVKEKREQYTVWYRQGEEIRLFTFKILHFCDLKMEKPKKDVLCPCYVEKIVQAAISNIIYSKMPPPLEEPKADFAPINEPVASIPMNPE
jgi:hypothetical protein